MNPSWLARVRSWLPGGRHVAPPTGHVVADAGPRGEVLEIFIPPPAHEAPPAKHVEALIALMHAAKLTGTQSHTEWLKHYPEAAWMNGLVEISERKLLRQIGLMCPKSRQMVRHEDGKMAREICYAVPKRRATLTVIPSAHLEDEIPFNLPERVRTGTSHAQA
jgi:hypothetical protein